MNFPYLEKDLLTVRGFISFCADRGIRVDEEMLEMFHKLRLLIPPIRLDAGVSGAFLKVKLKDEDKKTPHFIYEDDREKHDDPQLLSKKKFYIPASISFKPGWLKAYCETGSIDEPINDKRFLPWERYRQKHADFTTNANIYKNCRILMYSKDQMFILKHLLTWRSIKFVFNSPLSEAAYKKLNRAVTENLRFFDNNFKAKTLPDWLDFFTCFYAICNLEQNLYDEAKKHLELLSENDLVDTKEQDKEFNAAFKDAENRKYRPLAKKLVKDLQIDLKRLDEFREKTIHLAIQSREDFHLFKMIEQKSFLTKSQRRGKNQFMIDCMEIANQIEWFFGLINYKNFTSLDYMFTGNNTVKYCDICSTAFLPKINKDSLTCSPNCSKERKKRWKREQRRSSRK